MNEDCLNVDKRCFKVSFLCIVEKVMNFTPSFKSISCFSYNVTQFFFFRKDGRHNRKQYSGTVGRRYKLLRFYRGNDIAISVIIFSIRTFLRFFTMKLLHATGGLAILACSLTVVKFFKIHNGFPLFFSETN